MSRILCSVFKLVNNKTNPESLNELILLRETTYALRGKDILKVPKVNTMRFGPNSWRIRRPRSGTTCLVSLERHPILKRTKKKLFENCNSFYIVLIIFF